MLRGFYLDPPYDNLIYPNGYTFCYQTQLILYVDKLHILYHQATILTRKVEEYTVHVNINIV